MNVQVIVGLDVAAQEKHFQQMRRAASLLTDDPGSVRVFEHPEDPNGLVAAFTVPTALQGDVMNKIDQEFWNRVEDCRDSVTGCSGSSWT